MDPDISIIIPVINEGKQINGAIDHLKAQGISGSIQIVVVDGHKDGTTIRQIQDGSVLSITSPPGRARQMNCGAEAANGRILLFLHCDTRLPPTGLNDIITAMGRSSSSNLPRAGAFDLKIDKKGIGFRMIEWTASIRSRLTRIPYGDQAIFIDRDYFFSIGRYSNIPIMEDVDLMQRIKKDGRRIQILNLDVCTSARRWEKEGLIFCTLRNWMLMTLYLCGVSPNRLAGRYQNHN